MIKNILLVSVPMFILLIATFVYGALVTLPIGQYLDTFDYEQQMKFETPSHTTAINSSYDADWYENHKKLVVALPVDTVNILNLKVYSHANTSTSHKAIDTAFAVKCFETDGSYCTTDSAGFSYDVDGYRIGTTVWGSSIFRVSLLNSSRYAMPDQTLDPTKLYKVYILPVHNGYYNSQTAWNWRLSGTNYDQVTYQSYIESGSALDEEITFVGLIGMWFEALQLTLDDWMHATDVSFLPEFTANVTTEKTYAEIIGFVSEAFVSTQTTPYDPEAPATLSSCTDIALLESGLFDIYVNMQKAFCWVLVGDIEASFEEIKTDFEVIRNDRIPTAYFFKIKDSWDSSLASSSFVLSFNPNVTGILDGTVMENYTLVFADLKNVTFTADQNTVIDLFEDIMYYFLVLTILFYVFKNVKL